MSLKLIGSPAVGRSYLVCLSDLLGDRALVQATVASAYLTEEAVPRLLQELYLGRRGRNKPHVRILIGSMNGFTRKAAIRRLLRYARGGGESRSFPVDLEVLHPSEPLFHVKACHFRLRGRRSTALIGSHNLTGSGLTSTGELGAVLTGSGSREIGEALDSWVAQAQDWRSCLRQYREARLPRAYQAVSTRSGSEVIALFETAPAYETDGGVTARQEREVTRAVRKISGMDRNAKSYNWIWNSEETREEVLEQGYLPGSLCDVGDCENGSSGWTIGSSREIARVEWVLPVNGDKESVLLYTLRKKYRVTKNVLAKAKHLGLTREGAPEPRALGAFLHFLSSARSD